MNHLIEITTFIYNSFLHIWPYLIITIPIAVLVKVSGAAKYINRVMKMQPVLAIVLATLVGAFSPFCSCGVIPVITTLLIAGVPLAPVMSFWIASPSMDPEIIFLSAATIGWELTWWRLAATLIISLLAGFITLIVVKNGWIGNQILKSPKVKSVKIYKALIIEFISFIKERFVRKELKLELKAIDSVGNLVSGCCSVKTDDLEKENPNDSCGCTTECKEDESIINEKLVKMIFRETYEATLMVGKFMFLAFFLNALITLYVPADFITGILGGDKPLTVLLASVIGVPVYTSNITALPLIGGLLSQGMSPAAALAFLIAGPTTTLPAMAAVWGITNRKVFLLYLSFSLVGALIFGYIGFLIL
ncbi:MAG: permease [Bacteroidales bacterium]|nr:permease [Bacteroidales bacterium]